MAFSKKRKKTTHRKKKVAPKFCFFCKAGVKAVDYKDIARIQKFVTPRGKILCREYSGVCAKHQRSLSQAIKNARIVALLPFTERHAL